jgi:hypothetical protein
MSFLPVRVSRGIADAVRLLLFQDVCKTFWSESRVDVGAVLSAIADRLGHDAAVRHVDVDDGWWEDHDLTIAIRGGIRLDVQALMEDHGGGRSLCRLRIRPRLAAAPIPAMCGALALTLFPGAPPAVWWLGALVVGAAFGDVVLTSIALATALAEGAARAGMCIVGARATP